MIKFTESAIGKTRMNLGLHHLFAACRYGARIQEIEHENAGKEFGPFWEEILHNALGVATLTVASLESYANEMYFEGSILKDKLSSASIDELTRLIDRESVLRKYSVALAVRTDKHFDFGSTPVQNADALIKLRNAVVHFRPEWFGEQCKHDKLSRLLQHKFHQSCFLPTEPIFPRAWASASFAAWALKSNVEFLEHFYSEVGLDCPLYQFKDQLATLSNNML